MSGRLRNAALFLWALALSAVAGGCASSGARPQPFPVPSAPRTAAAPTPGGVLPHEPEVASANPSSSESGEMLHLVRTALSFRGTRYRNGGAAPDGFDCSGFTQYVFAQSGVQLPRETRDQFALGAPVRAADLQPGDLVFFSTTAPGPSHVGIAVGDGMFVHAPSSTGVVRVERLGLSYWTKRMIGIRRLPAN